MVKAREMEGLTVPKVMIDSLNRTLSSVQQLEAQLPQFLSHSDPELLSEMPLHQRAHTLFSLANLSSTLFSLKLRCKGINPDGHPVKTELDRLSVYRKKLERLPRLSEAWKQEMSNITNMSTGEGPNMNYQEQAGQKRKYPFSEEQSVQANAKEAIIIDISDDDDE